MQIPWHTLHEDIGLSVHAPETCPFSQTYARTTGSPSSWKPNTVLKQKEE